MATNYYRLPKIVERVGWTHRRTGDYVAIGVGACPWEREQDAQDWERGGLHYRFLGGGNLATYGPTGDNVLCYLPALRHIVTLEEAERELALLKNQLEADGFTVIDS